MQSQHPAVARVTHKFSASPQRVFDAWLDPEKVRIWWMLSAAAAGRGATETLERVQVDAQAGGAFSILVRRAGQLIDHTAAYEQIDRPRRLVFTWNATDLSDSGTPRQDPHDESRVIIEIAPLETGARARCRTRCTRTGATSSTGPTRGASCSTRSTSCCPSS